MEGILLSPEKAVEEVCHVLNTAFIDEKKRQPNFSFKCDGRFRLFSRERSLFMWRQTNIFGQDEIHLTKNDQN